MRHRGAPLGSGPSGSGYASAERHIVVLSRAHLVRDAVRTALQAIGHPAISLGVPTDPAHLRDARRWVARHKPATGLLITNLDSAAALRDAAAVVAELDIPWLILTETPPSPSWGALLEVGARDVLAADTDLRTVSEALTALGKGDPRPPDHRREVALRAWQELGENGREIVRRLDSLSPREMQILVELHRGHPVKLIAQRTGASEGTVRSQVKSVLRKLETNSQLAAVAMYEESTGWFNEAEDEQEDGSGTPPHARQR